MCTFVMNLVKFEEEKNHYQVGIRKKHLLISFIQKEFFCEDPPKFAFLGCIMRKSFD